MDNQPTPVEPAAREITPAVQPVRRPWSVTLLALGVLIITVINFTRFVLSLRQWSFLDAQLGVSPLYLALSGFVWTVAGAFLLWGLWTRKKWSPGLMQAEALTYALYYWLDLIFLKDHPLRAAGTALRVILPGNWPFSAGVTVVCLAFMVWALNRLKVKAYFGEIQPGAGSPQADDHQGS